MDDLPESAKEVLRLARGAHDPEDIGARKRVRAAIEEAVHPQRLASNAHSVLAGKAAGAVGTKLALALAAAVALGGGAAFYRSMQAEQAPIPTPPAPHAELAVPSRPEVALPAPLPESAEGVVPASDASRVRARGRARSQRDTLRDEVMALEQIDGALAQNDVAKARALLERHHARFERPALREERDGYDALLACLQRSPRADTNARAFLTRHPESVLAARVRRICRLEH